MNVALCQVNINADNLRHNMALLKGFGKPIMPVIKADAYGHGLLTVADILRDEGADRLAVGSVAEAVSLRQGGYGGTIIALLGVIFGEDIAAVREYAVVPLVHDRAGLERLADASAGAKSPLPIAVKCDTGMGRLGFSVEEIPGVAEYLAGKPQLRPDYFLSHLAAADTPEEDDYTHTQARRFSAAAKAMRARFPEITLSLGNSACLLSFPELAGDLARPGIALYGGNPLHGTAREARGAGLKPVMEVSTPVLSVHALKAGHSLGYGRTFVAPADMRVAVVGMGYADAYRRNPAAPGLCMTVHGRRVPVLGRVAMQMTCVDVTALETSGESAVRPGDRAFILGGEGQAVTPQDLAAWWGTIPYEVTCLLGKNLLG